MRTMFEQSNEQKDLLTISWEITGSDSYRLKSYFSFSFEKFSFSLIQSSGVHLQAWFQLNVFQFWLEESLKEIYYCERYNCPVEW